MLNYIYILSFAIISIFLSSLNAQPDDWKMTDRFLGFRYELYGNVINTNLETSIQNQADELGCFGWVQKTIRDTLVGEVRCSKTRGQQFLEFMKVTTDSSPTSLVERSVILIYEDTKIRLHFSHFKIIDEDRDTCFLDEPHKCVEFDNINDSSNRNTGNDEF